MSGGGDARQQMINMMYLVLTALLAMNVSKDVLNSFKLVNNGLKETNKILTNKNDDVYNIISASAKENPAKAQKALDMSLDVKKKSDDLINEIESLKLEIAQEGEKDIKSIEEIKMLDNIDASAIVMLREGSPNKKGKILKENLIKYKNYLKSLINPENTTLIETIDKIINTSDPKVENSPEAKWETEYFQLVPKIAAITILSKIQSDIKTVESNTITYILEQIDASSFKFNKLEPIVIPKTNYVRLGSKYEADIFLAAYDTTKYPEIYSKTGFKIRGFNSANFSNEASTYSKVPIRFGKGLYTSTPSKEGTVNWGGVIEFITSGKNKLIFPFESSFEVAASSVTVSADKMNVFYIGVDNPISISAPGATPSDLIIETTPNINITKTNVPGSFNLTATKGPTSKISVFIKEDRNKKFIGEKEFRVKMLPSPVAMVGGLKGGIIDKSLLLASGGVIPTLENFDFDVKFVVTSFEFSFINSGDIISETSNSPLFNDKILNYIKQLKPKQKVYFEEIKVRGPDGITREIGSLSFKIK